MDERVVAFQSLANVFKRNGFRLYLVGGSVRDYLLNLPLTDMDAVSDAMPEEIMAFLPNVDKSFAQYGSLKYKDANGIKFDITTLRKEGDYRDSRHPNKIVFVKSLEEDYPRRDFTVNAMYLDDELKIYDFCDGQSALKNHLLKMVGDPDTRLKEDPLRILRAIRFHLMYNLKIDNELLLSMKRNFHLLSNLTDAKIRNELDKIDEEKIDQQQKNEIFSQFDIANLHGVIK